jgi:hypothetical protein
MEIVVRLVFYKAGTDPTRDTWYIPINAHLTDICLQIASFGSAMDLKFCSTKSRFVPKRCSFSAPCRIFTLVGFREVSTAYRRSNAASPCNGSTVPVSLEGQRIVEVDFSNEQMEAA